MQLRMRPQQSRPAPEPPHTAEPPSPGASAHSSRASTPQPLLGSIAPHLDERMEERPRSSAEHGRCRAEAQHVHSACLALLHMPGLLVQSPLLLRGQGCFWFAFTESCRVCCIQDCEPLTSSRWEALLVSTLPSVWKWLVLGPVDPRGGWASGCTFL